MQTRLKTFRILSYYYLFIVTLIVAVALLVPLRWSVMEPGIVEPSNRQFIKPDVEGVISEILVQDGEVVTKGETIARIYDPQIALLLAGDEAEFEKAKMLLEFSKKMQQMGYFSDSELKQARIGYKLEATKLQQSKNFEIKAPMSGVLLTTDEINLRIGDKISAGTIIATVADLTHMRMKVRIHEHNISKVQIGNEVRVYLNAFPSMLYSTIAGTVKTIIPQAESDLTGTYFTVIIELNNNSLAHGDRRARLIPGMAGFAKIVYDRSSFFNHVIKKGFDTFSNL